MREEKLNMKLFIQVVLILNFGAPIVGSLFVCFFTDADFVFNLKHSFVICTLVMSFIVYLPVILKQLIKILKTNTDE